MSEHVEGRPMVAGALEGAGVTVNRMRAFAAAARRFWESAPWRHPRCRGPRARGGAARGARAGARRVARRVGPDLRARVL
jgi:hypothetical protein